MFFLHLLIQAFLFLELAETINNQKNENNLWRNCFQKKLN